MRSLPASLLLAAAATPAVAQGPVPDSFHKDIAALKAERELLLPHCETDLARAFLGAIDALPTPESRVLYWRRRPFGAWSEAEALATFGPGELGELIRLEWGEAEFYAPLYGTPLAYARPLDVVATRGFESAAGKRILDFGYGGVGQLRLLALLGADTVGVDVHPFLPAVYSRPADQGPILPPEGASSPTGSVRLVNGYWPADESVAEAVGGGFDLILTRNVLKRGFVHPEEPAKSYTELKAEDGVFLAALFEALAPGGLVLVYNLGYEPAAPGEPYRPQDDIGCAFEPDAWESAGFELLDFDTDDAEGARKHAEGYGWGSRPVFARFTIARRPR